MFVLQLGARVCSIHEFSHVFPSRLHIRPHPDSRQTIEQSSVRIDTVLSYCRYSLWDQELANYLPYFTVSSKWASMNV